MADPVVEGTDEAKNTSSVDSKEVMEESSPPSEASPIKDEPKEEQVDKTDDPEATNGTTENEESAGNKPAEDGNAKIKDSDDPVNDADKSKSDNDKDAAEEGKGPTKKEGKASDDKKQTKNSTSTGPVVSSTKKTRPPYKYDPNKVVLRFLFANRDGLTVTVECKPADTVGEVKAQLLSVWPDDLPECDSGEYLRLICMGKGMLMPDSRSLEDCQVPVFKTHPTPVNVAVRPKNIVIESTKSGKEKTASGSTSSGNNASRATEQSGQGCGCVIQ